MLGVIWPDFHDFTNNDSIISLFLQFHSFSETIECLFALINGDEIYTTFSIINLKDHTTGVWLFSRFYFYSFIFLSVFAIFNLFIAVIMDSYETVKVSLWEEVP